MTPTFKLAAFLSEALPYVDAWTPTEINDGGCGIFAAALSEELTKHGIDHTIVALSHGFDDTENKHWKNLNSFLQNGHIVKGWTAAQHIVVKVGDLYLDSDGVVNRFVMAADRMVEMSFDQLTKLNDVKSGWNPMFDRDCIPKIKELLADAFSKMDDFTTGMFKLPAPTEVEYTAHTIEHKKRLRVMQEFSTLGAILQHSMDHRGKAKKVG